MPEDAERLLHWRNDPATRAASFNEDEINLEEHTRWLTQKLADPRCLILIAERDGSPVAQVRFDAVEPELAEIAIAVAPEVRGRGLGREALELALGEAEQLLRVSRFRARVKSENIASLKLFSAVGFEVTRDGDTVELERDGA